MEASPRGVFEFGQGQSVLRLLNESGRFSPCIDDGALAVGGMQELATSLLSHPRSPVTIILVFPCPPRHGEQYCEAPNAFQRIENRVFLLKSPGLRTNPGGHLIPWHEFAGTKNDGGCSLPLTVQLWAQERTQPQPLSSSCVPLLSSCWQPHNGVGLASSAEADILVFHHLTQYFCDYRQFSYPGLPS